MLIDYWYEICKLIKQHELALPRHLLVTCNPIRMFVLVLEQKHGLG
jgi:hypothetical protein